MNDDLEHLKILSILHYVFGALIGLFACFPIIHLAARRRHLFCIVIAGIACIFMPLGTVLGIFTIIALRRPSVKELFTGGAARAPSTP